MEISRKMWNRNFYGGHLVLCKLGVFGPGCFDGNIPILKEEIHTVILIPLWLCPGGGCTWDPGGPRTIILSYASQISHNYLVCGFLLRHAMSIFRFCHNSEPKPLLEQLNIIFNININHSMLHNTNNGIFPSKQMIF